MEGVHGPQPGENQHEDRLEVSYESNPMSLPDPITIARLEEAHLARSIASVSTATMPCAGGILSRGTPGSWQNKAVGLGMDGPVAPEAIGALIDFYASAGIEPRIEVNPYADATLRDGLAGAGFVVRRFAQAFALELPAVQEIDVEGALPPGASVEVVDPKSDDRVREYAVTGATGMAPFGMTTTEADLKVWVTMARTPGYVCIIARIDGRPASSGAMEVSGPYSRLFGLGTLPEFRRRGLQRVGLLARLRLARERGAAFATITSEPAGPTERNALRVGFRPIFTRAIMVRPAPGLVPVGG